MHRYKEFRGENPSYVATQTALMLLLLLLMGNGQPKSTGKIRLGRGRTWRGEEITLKITQGQMRK